MFPYALKTKLIWSLSHESFLRHGSEKIAHFLLQHPQLAVRSVYTAAMKKSLIGLRQTLSQTDVQSAPDVQCLEGLFPYVLTLIGRRAVLKVPAHLVEVTLGQQLDIAVRVDVLGCTDFEFRNSDQNHLEILVTAKDMLSAFTPQTTLSISFDQLKFYIDDVVSKDHDQLHLKVTVQGAGQPLTGMDVTSLKLHKNLFPLLPEDEVALKERLSDCCDYLIVQGLRSKEELSVVKSLLLGQGHQSSAHHPTLSDSKTALETEAYIPPKIVYKVDSGFALELLDSVFGEIDGVYLSRSELGMTTDPYLLPIVQKELIAKCNQSAKLIMVASELLYSMRIHSAPTRAEVSDITNLVADGADVLVLAEEVTEGAHGHEVAKVAHEIIMNAEDLAEPNWHRVPFLVGDDDDAIAVGAIEVAEHTGARAIVCLTQRGYTAQRFSSLRPPLPIIAVTYNKRVMRQLGLLGLVTPLWLENNPPFDQLLTHIKGLLLKHCGLQKGDRIVFVSLTASSVSAHNSNLFTLQEL